MALVPRSVAQEFDLTMRTTEDRIAGLTEQIRRDLAVLAGLGPATYCPDRAFYEERVRGCRETAAALQKQLDNASPTG